jgi:hypothetical protein
LARKAKSPHRELDDSVWECQPAPGQHQHEFAENSTGRLIGQIIVDYFRGNCGHLLVAGHTVKLETDSRPLRLVLLLLHDPAGKLPN